MLDLVLYGPEGPQPVGRPAPIQVEVRNTGAREVWIAGVLDGSEAGLRYPHYLPSVTLAGSGRTVARARAGRGSARRAAAGGRPAPTDARSFDPMAGARPLPLLTFAPRTPGRYVYALTLSTEAGRPEEWLSGFGLPSGTERKELLGLVARAPRVTGLAGPVVVEFCRA
ncbi:hypothetical protein ACWDG1_48490 [Streptomyces sp. NPDC001177]